MNIELEENKIISEFNNFDNWEDKYKYLIEIGKNYPGISKKDREEKYLIKGCQSMVWIKTFLKKKNIYLQIDSNTLLTKGIATILVRVYSGASIEKVISHNINFINKIGFNEFLSPIRTNGIYLMIKQIKLYALVYMNNS